MQQARDDAFRRYNTGGYFGEVLEKQHVYGCQLAKKLVTNKALDENQKLKKRLKMAEHKLSTKDSLLRDSLNCTFVACPCSQNSKMPNVNLIFKLRKKIIELRDLVALQEVELVNVH